MDGWNTTFLLGFGLFSGAMLVSGRVTFILYVELLGVVIHDIDEVFFCFW